MQSNIPAPVGAESDSVAIPAQIQRAAHPRASQRSSLNAADIELIAQRVADLVGERLAAELRARPAPPPLNLVPLLLTVEQFGIAINRSPKVVRRRIAERFIDRAHVSGPPYAISREALAKFKVPFPAAAERLEAAKSSRSEGGAA